MFRYIYHKTLARSPSFLSDRAQFRFISLVELMYIDDIYTASSRYDALGGDTLLRKFDCDPHPDSVFRRLEVAEGITEELDRQEQWSRLGHQPLADAGIQLFCMFEGMFNHLKRDFVDKLYTKLSVDRSSCDPTVTNLEFMNAIDIPLRTFARGPLACTGNREHVDRRVDLLFKSFNFISELFKQQPAMLQLLQHTIGGQGHGTDILSHEAFSFCCQAVAGSMAERHTSIGKLCKLGNPKRVCPVYICTCIYAYIVSIQAAIVNAMW